MIGNDIIDLTLARKESNWQRRGWLQKLFSDTEQEQIWGSGIPELKVWQFWSMKEAAYKAHQRRCNLSPKFNPRDFQCITDHSVVHSSMEYTTQTETYDRYIHTIALGPYVDYASQVYPDPIQAKYELRKLVSDHYKLDVEAVLISKDKNRIPNIEVGRKKLSVSLSSHGSYSAFLINSCYFMPCRK